MKKLIANCSLVLAAALTFASCSAPRVAPDNLRLTASLRTAISTRQAEWLEQNVSAIEARKTAGEMSDAEYDAFQSIIAKAKAGEWEAAEKAIVRLQKAQRPTKEQIGRLPKIES